MIGWVIAKTAPQKEHRLLHDIVHISKNAPIPAYIPVHLFYRNLSRYAQARKPVRELIAPRLVFVQAGHSKIKLIESMKRVEQREFFIPNSPYMIGKSVEGTIDKVQQFRHFEGFVLSDDGETPYVIPHDTMTQFMVAIDQTNLFVERMEQEALGRIGEAKKTTWLKLGEDIRTRLLAIVGITRS